MLSLSSKFQKRVKSKKETRKWWLFHAKNFQSLMYPCFIFCRILGIFPYKINASIFEISRSHYILSAIITCITCVYELANLYEVLRTKTEVARKIQENCFSMLGGFIVIVSFVLSGPRMRLLQTILEVSSKLSPKSYEKLSKLIHVKDIFGFFILIGQTLLSILHFYQYNNFSWFFMDYYIGFQMIQLNMLYVNCVCVLKACFKRIDKNLTNLRMLVINDKLHIPRFIYYQQRNPFLLKEIKILEKQYLMVSNTVQMLNINFSPQLLATIAITFSEITFEIYFNMVQWKNGLSINLTNKQIRNTCFMSGVIYHIINIALMVWACETGKNQAMKISTTVHDVLNNTSDEQIKAELHLFSLQILHCNNTFSAKGLTVDAMLLTAMVGTITTYILILIQFLIITHSCDIKIATNVVETI